MYVGYPIHFMQNELKYKHYIVKNAHYDKEVQIKCTHSLIKI